MTSTPPDWHRIALALNNVATTLQQLAVECDIAARGVRVVIPDDVVGEQMGPAQLRTHLAGGMFRTTEERTADLASVAEPVCGCSLYTRCEEHSTEKRCKCNGPAYRSSACLITYHAQQGRSMPDRDPALAD